MVQAAIGVLSALLAICCMGLYALQREFPDILMFISREVFLVVLGVMMVTGIVSRLSTFCVNRVVKLKSSAFYY